VGGCVCVCVSVRCSPFSCCLYLVCLFFCFVFSNVGLHTCLLIQFDTVHLRSCVSSCLCLFVWCVRTCVCVHVVLFPVCPCAHVLHVRVQAPDGTLMDITVLLETRLLEMLMQEQKREHDRSTYRRGGGRPRRQQQKSESRADLRADRKKNRKEARKKKKERQDQYSTHAKPKVRPRKAH
jgi:hypothetical protein